MKILERPHASAVMRSVTAVVGRLLCALLAISVATMASAQVSLTATSTTYRSANAGGSFGHVITLRNGATPLVGKTVAIHDPVVGATFGKVTNSIGQVSHTSTSSTYAQPGVYTLAFSYGSVRTTSAVVIRSASGSSLPSYSFLVASSNLPASSTLAIGRETSSSGLSQSASSLTNEAVSLGWAVMTDYVSNPVNATMVGITAVSCTVGLLIPGGGAVCVALVKAQAIPFALTVGKVLAKRWVDSEPWSAADKIQAKAVIDLASCAISFTRLSADGVNASSYLSSGWTCGSAAGSLLKVNGQVRGGSMAGQIAGTNEVLQVSFYKR